MKILVIEDEEYVGQLLCLRLRQEGYQVLWARDAGDGLQLMQQQEPHLVLLDIILPHMNGWEACRRIRECSDVPIIILTVLGADQDKVRGLDLGADDYLTKPFSMAELVARIRAALRRYGYPAPESKMVNVDNRLVVDRVRRRVGVDGEWVELSPTEYRILNCFLDNTGRILTHQSLLIQVWGWEYTEATNYLKVYIHHLRRKIEKDPREPGYILTERGLGYRFQVPGAA